MPQIKVKRAITVPVLKMQNGVPAYFRIETGIFEGKALGNKEAPKMVRATVFSSETLEPIGQHDVILPTIAYRELVANYGETSDSLAGKCFAMTKTSIEGKKYNAVDLAEIDDPQAGQEGEETPAPRKGRR